jgi:hypothetical protein
MTTLAATEAQLARWDWRASSKRSAGWIVFEWLFGFALPILCFAVDALGMDVYGGATVAARVLVATELILFLIWKSGRAEGEFAAALIGTAFGIGAAFALMTAVALLPASLIGCIALIGFLGLVPFGTSVVFARLSFHALSRASTCPGARTIAGAALGIILIVTPFVSIRASERAIGRRALAMLDGAEPASAARVWIVLAELPRCDTSDLPEAQYGSLLRGDLTKWCTNSWIEELASFPMRYY